MVFWSEVWTIGTVLCLCFHIATKDEWSLDQCPSTPIHDPECGRTFFDDRIELP